ncbi:hypothetical protein NDU88_003160 [Pleurodeles waltl]|uniref:Uncharacterized protein n=1 Tax=Pleurodeles waltl TaxID=8319 RepID=A0AAV7MZD6_PLEWA|nr:hypothetical protein NDU88_003160 [Pleurodeles waltl]
MWELETAGGRRSRHGRRVLPSYTVRSAEGEPKARCRIPSRGLGWRSNPTWRGVPPEERLRVRDTSLCLYHRGRRGRQAAGASLTHPCWPGPEGRRKVNRSPPSGGRAVDATKFCRGNRGLERKGGPAPTTRLSSL